MKKYIYLPIMSYLIPLNLFFYR